MSAAAAGGGEEAGWSASQKKTFTKWLQSQTTDDKPVEDLLTYFSSGDTLIRLLHRLFPGIPVPKHTTDPSLRVQKLDNATVALEMLGQCGVSVPFLKPANLVDGDESRVMGLIWALILEVQIYSGLMTHAVKTETMRRPDADLMLVLQEVQQQRSPGLSSFDGARGALLKWVQERTDHYDGVNVTDFQDSFADGKAFVALVDSVAPGVIDFDAVAKEDSPMRHYRAFQAAANSLGIYPLLDVDDMVSSPMQADNKSVMTYVSEFLKFWNSEERLAGDIEREFAAMRLRQAADDDKTGQVAPQATPDLALHQAADPRLETQMVSAAAALPPDNTEAPAPQNLSGAAPPDFDEIFGGTPKDAGPAVSLAEAEPVVPIQVAQASAPVSGAAPVSLSPTAVPPAGGEAAQPGGFWVQPPPKVISTTYTTTTTTTRNNNSSSNNLNAGATTAAAAPAPVPTRPMMMMVQPRPMVMMTAVAQPQPQLQRKSSTTVTVIGGGRRGSRRQPQVITTTVGGAAGGGGGGTGTTVVTAGGSSGRYGRRGGPVVVHAGAAGAAGGAASPTVVTRGGAVVAGGGVVTTGGGVGGGGGAVVHGGSASSYGGSGGGGGGARKSLSKTKLSKKELKRRQSAGADLSSGVALDDGIVASTPRVDARPVANPAAGAAAAAAPAATPSPAAGLPLPAGFEAKLDASGRTFYVDHNAKTTSFRHPMEACPAHLLPAGWEVKLDGTGRPFYVNHTTKTTQYASPVQW